MKNLWIILAICWLVGGACRRKDAEPQRISCDDFVKTAAEANPLILGRWQWEQTYTFLRGMTAPRIETPQSAGYSEELVFNPGGTVESYRNGQLLATQRYTIQDVPGEATLYLHLTELNGTAVPSATDLPLLRICPDRLTLSYSYNDSGGDKTYRKL
ncbi:hypothetical protein GCM10023187_19880 [Nibrella viscosa]|uniref:Lipocalin-like domain-containing protein n=1 Tax=Nibrella viscosa TaxID=1084524 RepID=A0ABP8KC83_9BACT